MPENSISSSPCWTGTTGSRPPCWERIGRRAALRHFRHGFALTALFVVLFLEQLRQKQRRLPGAIGIACAVVALLVCVPDNLVIPSMVLIFASLLIGRKKLCA